jgi:hypothetical protein
MYQLQDGMSGHRGARVSQATITETSTPTIAIEKNPASVMKHPIPVARARRSARVSAGGVAIG